MLALKESIEKCVITGLQRLFEWSTMYVIRETAHDYSSINHRNKFTFIVTVHCAFGPIAGSATLYRAKRSLFLCDKSFLPQTPIKIWP